MTHVLTYCDDLPVNELWEEEIFPCIRDLRWFRRVSRFWARRIAAITTHVHIQARTQHIFHIICPFALHSFRNVEQITLDIADMPYYLRDPYDGDCYVSNVLTCAPQGTLNNLRRLVLGGHCIPRESHGSPPDPPEFLTTVLKTARSVESVRLCYNSTARVEELLEYPALKHLELHDCPSLLAGDITRLQTLTALDLTRVIVPRGFNDSALPSLVSLSICGVSTSLEITNPSLRCLHAHNMQFLVIAPAVAKQLVVFIGTSISVDMKQLDGMLDIYLSARLFVVDVSGIEIPENPNAIPGRTLLRRVRSVEVCKPSNINMDAFGAYVNRNGFYTSLLNLYGYRQEGWRYRPPPPIHEIVAGSLDLAYMRRMKLLDA